LDHEWLARLKVEGASHLLSSPTPPPALFYKGVEQFNRGAFWHAHETWEEVWRETAYPLRLFYYGLIKAAVGFEHVGRRHQRSAVSQFRAAIENLGPFPAEFQGVRMGLLLGELEAWLPRVGTASEPDWDALAGLPRPKLALAIG
jgi:predicted metal-dependent hydrolase